MNCTCLSCWTMTCPSLTPFNFFGELHPQKRMKCHPRCTMGPNTSLNYRFQASKFYKFDSSRKSIILDLECIGVPTSAIAAAALKTSYKVFGYKWDRTLTHYSDYTSDELDVVGSRLFYVSFLQYLLQHSMSIQLTQKASKIKLDSPFGKQRKRYSSPVNDSVAQKFI